MNVSDRDWLPFSVAVTKAPADAVGRQDVLDDDIVVRVARHSRHEACAQAERQYVLARDEPAMQGKLESPVRASELTGAALEKETHHLFRALGCLVKSEDPNVAHDGAVYYPPNELPDVAKSSRKPSAEDENAAKQDAKPAPSCRMVLEIKSSRKWGSLKDLRQLDDWVYQVSGEEELRKGNAIDFEAIASGGTLSISGRVAGRRHKGVLVFNPIGRPLSKALAPDWETGHVQFAENRAMCMMTFQQLVYLVSCVARGEADAEWMLKAIDSTQGALDVQTLCSGGPSAKGAQGDA